MGAVATAETAETSSPSARTRSSKPRAVAAGAIMRASWPPPTTPITGKVTSPSLPKTSREPGFWGLASAGTVPGRGFRTRAPGARRRVGREPPERPLRADSLETALKWAFGPMADSSRRPRRVMITTLNERMRGLASLFWREVAKFGAVGGIAFIIDNGLTFYLMHGPMTDSEAKARFFGATVATVFSWIANRFWTFRHRRQANVLREFVMFLIINGIGIGISTGLTAVAKYGMGVTDKNMLFLAGVVGILVATVVRFFAYRFLVFNQELDAEPEVSHDHAIIERHPHSQPVATSAVRERVNDSELPGPPS